MISSTNSMKLGILWIDPDRVIFQKSVLGILYGYSIFLDISFRVIDDWYSEFSIIGLLYCARYYQGFLIFSILAYSQSGIKYAVQRKFYCRAVLSVGIIWHRSKTYTAGSAEDFYILVIDQST